MRNNIILFLIIISSLSCVQKSEDKTTNGTEKSIYKNSRTMTKDSIKNILNGKDWYIDKIIKTDDDFFKLKALGCNTKEDTVWYDNIFYIKNDTTFVSGKAVECMADCYPHSYGTIKMINKDTIIIYVKDFKQDGMCEKIDEKINKNLGLYVIQEISKYEVELLKVKQIGN